MTPAYTRFAAWSLAALFAFGILTLWVRDRWALAIFHSGVLLTTLIWSWLNLWFRGSVRFHPVLLPLAAIPLCGLLQILTGLTVFPWATSESVIEWTATLAAAFLFLQALASFSLRSRLENALLLFSTAIAVLAIFHLFTAQGRFLWIFDTGYVTEVLGPFVYRNKYAQFAEIAFPLALWRAIADHRRAPLFLTSAALIAAGVVAGASRAGAAFLLAEIAAVLLLAARRQALSLRAAALSGLSALAAVSLWGAVVGWDFFWQRLTGIDPLQDYRWPIMASTFEMIRQRPLLGYGLGTWPTVYPQFATFDIGVFVNQAHCDWLQWTAEGGLPLLAAFIAIPALLLKRLLHSVWGVGFLTVLAHAALDYPFHQLPAFTTFLLCAALLAAEDRTGI
ncbi:MAG: O-antigen ligase family protein [Acidobacteria bacterium]|nr:O-antigen ligase family protein [Acidobacteriota bacterium]